MISIKCLIVLHMLGQWTHDVTKNINPSCSSFRKNLQHLSIEARHPHPYMSNNNLDYIHNPNIFVCDVSVHKHFVSIFEVTPPQTLPAWTFKLLMDVSKLDTEQPYYWLRSSFLQYTYSLSFHHLRPTLYHNVNIYHNRRTWAISWCALKT